MRKIRHHTPPAVAAAAWAALSVAHGQDANGVPIIVPSQSSIYNQNSMSLPNPPVVHGQDIVRGASGVSCQSAVAGNGPYLDVGVIGAQDVFSRDTAAVYGRIVVPLGRKPKRPDCTKLYELEIARMRMEIDMLRMGLPTGAVYNEAAYAPAQQGQALVVPPNHPASAPPEELEPPLRKPTSPTKASTMEGPPRSDDH